jgi:hypothetical protein
VTKTEKAIIEAAYAFQKESPWKADGYLPGGRLNILYLTVLADKRAKKGAKK